MKGDYRAHVLKENESVNHKLDIIQNKIVETHDQIVEDQHYVEDTLDTWETGVNQFNKAIKQAAKRNNIVLEPKKEEWDCFSNVLTTDSNESKGIVRLKLRKEETIDNLNLDQDSIE